MWVSESNGTSEIFAQTTVLPPHRQSPSLDKMYASCVSVPGLSPVKDKNVEGHLLTDMPFPDHFSLPTSKPESIS